MLRSYDFIFGKKITDYHTQSIYKDRILTEELTTPLALLDIVDKELANLKTQVVTDIEPDCLTLMTNISTSIGQLKANPNADVEYQYGLIREYIATMNFLGYNMFLFVRMDLNSDTPIPMIMDYCYDFNSDIVPNIGQIARAWGTEPINKESATVTDCVMNFIGNIIIFNSVTNSIVGLDDLRNKFLSLKEVGMDSAAYFDVNSVIDLTRAIGYKFQIIY